MQGPSLNVDILAMITSFASRQTISAMMQANRFFYHEGPKTLLRNGVTFLSDSDILTFVRFMRAEDGMRSRYLTGLAIGPFHEGPDMQEDSARMLTEFLRTSSFDRLKTLRIDDAEDHLKRHPDLLAAFKTLSGVERFAMESCDRIACGLLREMGGGMREVMLSYENEDVPGSSPADLPDVHPLLILQPSRDTLESLELRFMDWVLPPSLYPQPFPNVCELTVAWAHNPSLSPYIHAFPNLRCLQLDHTYDEEAVDIPGELAPLREANRVDQLRQGSWQSLDEVTGDVADIYASGLQCRVRRLVLMMRDETFTMLADVVNDMRPSSISLYVGRERVFDPHRGIPAVLAQPGAKELVELELNVQLAPEDKDLEVTLALAYLVASMHGLPLRSVEVVFNCSDLPLRRGGIGQGGTAGLPQCWAEKCLQVMNLEVLAHFILSGVETLREVTLSIKELRHNDDRSVVVTRSEGIVDDDERASAD